MTEPKTIDLLIEGGTILTLDTSLRVLEDHCLAIDQGRILDIFPSGTAAYSARQTIDAKDCIVMPGLINAHTHLPMTYFRGLADDLPLHNWLHDFIWPLETKLVNPSFVYDASLHGAAEMIKNGITQIHDMYFHMADIADACTRAGLRAIVGEAVLEAKDNTPADRSSIGSKVLEYRQRYRDNPLIDFSLSAHSIYACSRPTLQRCAEVAAEHSILLHLHLAESPQEVTDCLRQNGCQPVFYLQEIGFMQLPAVYAHGIWVDEDEMDVLAESPASIAICTESNLKLASGILPLAAYLRHGVNTCFATDGVASNNNLDLLSEMDFTAKLHKALNNDPSFLPAQQIVQMATINAACALGVADRRGSLETGKDADICILALDSLPSQPIYNPYSHVVYALGSSAVRDVVIAGEVVLSNGKLTRVDEAELIATAKTYQKKIQRQLQQ